MPTNRNPSPQPSQSRARQFRLQKIDEALRSKTYPSASRLAKICEVSLRTIERDIDFLVSELNAPIEYDATQRGWYYIKENFYIPYFQITQGELFSITLFDPILKQYRNTPIEADLRSVFQKIIRSFPEECTFNSDFAVPDITFISDGGSPIESNVFSVLMTATLKHETIRFEYKPLQKNTFMERELEPYHIVCQRGNWYVLGFCQDKNEVRIFIFSRMKNPKKTGKHFKVPKDFSPEKYIDPSMGVWLSAKEKFRVKLLFDSSIGTFASEHFWHENQKVKQNKDGSVQVEFETTQMPEVKRWVLGQGATVKVLEPPQLITAIKEELEKARKLY